jgi:hypothetical protein
MRRPDFAQLLRTFRYLIRRLWEKCMRLPEPPKIPDDRLTHYFMPDQAVLLVKSRAEIHRAELPKRLLDNTIVRSNDLLRRAVEQGIRRVSVFPPGRDQQWSALAFLDLPADEATLLRLMDEVNERLSQQPEQGDLVVAAISPNWLMTSAHHAGALGGPGTDPIPDEPAPGAWKFTMPGDIQQAIDKGTGREAIEVAILDTAPCAHQLADAYHRWRKATPNPPENPLIDSLLKPDGPLTISYASWHDLAAMGGYDLHHHRYNMADHGLFAAGVIHSIAPNARLHLVEVLNQYGVGTLESVAAGFERLAEPGRKLPQVINCSLVLNMPLPEHLPTLAERKLNWSSLTQNMILLMSQVLEGACDGLRVQDVLIVAAAGNDAEPGMLPQARYPAAFNSVIGVGSLRRDLITPAEYSNQSDLPVKTGIATFGGAPLTAGVLPEEGMLGVYTGAFPDGSPNKYGWARWSGTSFAAPVISGVLAGLRGADLTASDAHQLLTNMLIGSTAIGRKFPATQG